MNAIPSLEHQQGLIPPMLEVVKNKIIKLLNVGVIYPMTDIEFVNPVHSVPKKG